MAVVRLTRSLPDEAAAMPLSISRPEILVDGSDGDFRRLIHRMLIGSARLSAVRDAIADRIGVSGANYTMLMSVLRLQGAAGVSISALADYLEVSGPYVTGVINKLSEQGFVRKAANPKDRRGVLVRLTPTGRRRLLQAFEFIRNVNDRLFEGVGRDEYRAIANFNAKFIRNTQATLDWIDRQPEGRSRSRAADI